FVEGLIRAIDQTRGAVDQRVFQFHIALPLGLCSCAPSQTLPSRIHEGPVLSRVGGRVGLVPLRQTFVLSGQSHRSCVGEGRRSPTRKRSEPGTGNALPCPASPKTLFSGRPTGTSAPSDDAPIETT